MGVDHVPESLGQAIEQTAGSEFAETEVGTHVFARYVDRKREACLETASRLPTLGDRPLRALT